jgi:hypothetical protein
VEVFNVSRTKLTLYVDKDIARLAHKTARLSGQSISNIVQDYFIEKGRRAHSKEISASVSKWIGILETRKTYKDLRGEHVDNRRLKYEDTA